MAKRYGDLVVDIPTAASLMYAAVHQAIENAMDAATEAERERIIAETVRFVAAAVCPMQLAANTSR